MNKEPIQEELHPLLLHKQLPNLTRALVERVLENGCPVRVEINILPPDD